MSEAISKIGMRPCHPGEFIREEILRELNLSIARAAEIEVKRYEPAQDHEGARFSRFECLRRVTRLQRRHELDDNFGKTGSTKMDHSFHT